MEKLQQHSEAFRAELQSTKTNNSSLSQQVADLEAAAAMHLAHQVSQQSSSLQYVSQLCLAACASHTVLDNRCACTLGNCKCTSVNS